MITQEMLSGEKALAEVMPANQVLIPNKSVIDFFAGSGESNHNLLERQK